MEALDAVEHIRACPGHVPCRSRRVALGLQPQEETLNGCIVQHLPRPLDQHRRRDTERDVFSDRITKVQSSISDRNIGVEESPSLHQIVQSCCKAWFDLQGQLKLLDSFRYVARLKQRDAQTIMCLGKLRFYL